MSHLKVNQALFTSLGGGGVVRRSEQERRDVKRAIFTRNAETEGPQLVKASKLDDEKQIVYGCVYAPGVLDTYGEFMTANDIEEMAHRYMKSVDLTKTIDLRHDNVPTECYPVESFIARRGDPDYPEGSWVLGVKVPDRELWVRIKTGEFNGFSFQAMVAPVEMDIQYEIMRDHVGPTERAADHTHAVFVQVNEEGLVTSGRTSKAADGHFHEVSRASMTDTAKGHSHRYFL